METTSHRARRAKDAWVATQCLQRRPGGWEALVRRFERPLLYFVAQRVGAQVAPEVLQEVWLSAYRSLGSLDDPEGLRAWLYQFARRHAIDWMRQHGKHQAEVRVEPHKVEALELRAQIESRAP